MASRLIGGIIYSDIACVIPSHPSSSADECIYRLKMKHSVRGYICKTSCGCSHRHYLGERRCGYCGKLIKFVGRKGQPKSF